MIIHKNRDLAISGSLSLFKFLKLEVLNNMSSFHLIELRNKVNKIKIFI